MSPFFKPQVQEYPEEDTDLERVYKRAQNDPNLAFALSLAIAKGGRQTYEDVKSYPKPARREYTEELFTKPYEYSTFTPDLPLKGFVNNNIRDYTFTNTNQSNNRARFIRNHETEHVLQNKGGMPYSGGKFDYTRGDLATAYDRNARKNDTSAEFARRLSNIAPSLAYKYPELVYLKNPDSIKEAVSMGNFHEILADLAALERHRKLDFKKDPLFRELFAPEGSYEAYRSVTGLRNIQTDPKDIPARSMPDEKERWRGGAIREMNDTSSALTKYLKRYLPFYD